MRNPFRALWRWAAYLFAAPAYPTTPPLDVSAWPTRYNPRATVYPHPDAVLLSGTGNTETPPALQAGLGMPPACEAMWRGSAGQRHVEQECEQ